jgi:hypothetical protein
MEGGAVVRSQYKHITVEKLAAGTLIAWPIRHIGYSTICEAKLAVEIRPVPEADWTNDDRVARQKPSYITITDPDGRNEAHFWVAGGHVFSLLPEHYGVCAHCGQLWPCVEQVIESELLLQRHAMENKCCVCNKRLGNRRGELLAQTPDGPVVQRYHTVKGSKCRRAFTLAAARDPEALERLRAEDEGRPYTPLRVPRTEGGASS